MSRINGKISLDANASLSYTLTSPSSESNSPKLVVFVNGLRTSKSDWEHVVSELLSMNSSLYTLSFDRWSCGDSDPLPPNRIRYDLESCAKDLHDLILAVSARHKLPRDTEMLLVGSSIGCCIIRLTLERFNHDLAKTRAIVFLDSYISNTDFTSLFPKPEPQESKALTKTRNIISRIFHPSVGNPEGLDRSNAAELLPSSSLPVISGNPQVVVVCHDPEYNVKEMVEKLDIDKSCYLRYVQSAWDQYNNGLQQLSSSSRKITAENSAHFIYKDRADIVVAEILKCLE